MKHWILEGKEMRQVGLEEWAKWFQESPDQHLADTMQRDVRISTVFLGIDHSFGMGGPPILFETMIFGGRYEGDMQRAATYDEALAYHANAVKNVERSQGWLRWWFALKDLWDER